MLLAETRRNEQKGQLCSSKSFFREPPVLEDSLLHSVPLQSFKSSSVSCMAAIHTFWLPRNTDCWLARDVRSSVGRFESHNSAVPEKSNSQRSEESVFLKMNKAGKYLLERLRAPASFIYAELQGCDMGSSNHNTGAPRNTELLSWFSMGWFLPDFYAIQITA